MTAHKVWEFRPTPEIFSDRISNALRLPNGNTLVNFGFRDDPGAPALLVEASPSGSPVWSLQLRWSGSRVQRYRAYPLDSLAGERPSGE